MEAPVKHAEKPIAQIGVRREHLLRPRREPGDLLHGFGFAAVHDKAEPGADPTDLRCRSHETSLTPSRSKVIREIW